MRYRPLVILKGTLLLLVCRLGVLTPIQAQAPARVHFLSSSDQLYESEAALGVFVSRTGDLSTSVSVAYVTEDRTAQAGSDYTMTSGELTFEPGQSIRGFVLPILNDSVRETTETFTLRLLNPQGGVTIATPEVMTVTILDNDGGAGLAPEQPAVAETAGRISFTVWRGNADPFPFELDYATSDGTALAIYDYLPAKGTLVFGPGEYERTVTIAILEDDQREWTEKFYLTLSHPLGSLALGSNTRTIISILDAHQPIRTNNAIRFDASWAEVPEHGGAIQLNVWRESAPELPSFTVGYSTADGTATRGQDYAESTGVLEFATNQLKQTLTIPILNDGLRESREHFFVKLAQPSHSHVALGAPAEVRVWIDDNDPGISFTGSQYEVLESQGVVSVTIQRGNDRDLAPFTLRATTADGSARQAQDYEALDTVLRFAEHQQTQTLAIPIVDNAEREQSEAFRIKLSEPSGSLDLGTPSIATVWVHDDESTVTFETNDVYVNENAAEVTLSVRRSQNTAPSTVNYATTDGTAQAERDYKATHGTLSFAAGQTSLTIIIPILNDGIREPGELFRVALSQPSEGTSLGSFPTATVRIQDNDPGVAFAVADQTVSEAEASVVMAVYRGGDDHSLPFSVDYTTLDGAAIDGEDYQATSGTLTFAPGEVTRFITVPILNDAVKELNQSFRVTLRPPTGGFSLGSPTNCTVAIIDNDTGIRFSAASTTVLEAGGSVSLTVLRGNDIDLKPLTVDYATGDGTAQAAFDYGAVSGTLRFEEGELSKTIQIPILNDGWPELPETFRVALANPSSSKVLASPALTTVIIEDNDPGPHFVYTTPSTSEDRETLLLRVSRGNDQHLDSFTIDYITVDGSAQAGRDYERAAGSLQFSTGEITKTLAIRILNDSFREQPETFQVSLSNVVGPIPAGIPKVASITIHDNDPGPTLATSAIRVDEGAGVAQIDVLRGNDAAYPEQTIHVIVEDDPLPDPSPARASHDYIAPSTTLTFSEGASIATLRIPIVDDALDEGDETFRIRLFETNGIHQTQVRILDNDGPLRWTLRHHNTLGRWARGVGFGDGHFVAVGWEAREDGDFPRVAVSTNGWDWALGRIPASATQLYDVAVGNGRAVAIGASYDAETWISTNLTDWSRGTSGLPEWDPSSSRILFALERFFVWNPWGSSSQIFSSLNGIDWDTAPLPLPISDMTFGNGLLAAAGPDGILTSHDGRNWACPVLPTPRPLTAIGFGDGQFLALSETEWTNGLGRIQWLSSSDGRDWATATVTSTDWFWANRLQFHNGRFLGGNLLTQREGEGWRIEPTQEPHWQSAAVGAGLIVGSWGRGLLTSRDGLQWASPDVWLRHLAANSDSLIAAGGFTFKESMGGILGSVKGQAWIPQESPTSSEIKALAYGQGRFVACASSGVLVSTDARSWVLHGRPVASPESLAFGNDRFVMLGYAHGTGVLTSAASSNGIDWASATLPSNLEGYFQGGRSLAFSGGQFLALTSSGAVLLSTDGLQWTRSSTIGAQRVVAAGNQFAAWSEGSAEIWLSRDGSIWTQQTFDLSYGLADFAWGGGLYVAVLHTWSEPVAKVWVSRDLNHWSACSPPGGQSLGGVHFAHGRFHLLGDQSTIYQSEPVVQLFDIHSVDQGIQFSFTGDPQSLYDIQTSDNLITWEMAGPATRVEDRFFFESENLPATPQRFYRVVERRSSP